MKRADDLQNADFMLSEWYEWSKAYRPNLGAPRLAPSCRQSVSTPHYEADHEEGAARLHKQQMEAVEFCVDQLAGEHQRVIGIEMRNRQGSRVWRDPSGTRFADALHAVIPIMRKRGLFD